MAVFETFVNDPYIQLSDLEFAKYNQQWYANAVVDNTDVEKRQGDVSEIPEGERTKRVFFVTEIYGTDIVVTRDGKPISGTIATGNLEMHDSPLRLGHKEWSISGATITFVKGFYVDVLGRSTKRPPIGGLT